MTLLLASPAVLLCGEPRSTPAHTHKLDLTGTGLSEPGWALRWSDEFNNCPGGVPDPAVWAYEVGFSRGDELQYNTNRGAQCVDGKLRITAQAHPEGIPVPEGDLPSCDPSKKDVGACEEWRRKRLEEPIFWSSASLMSLPAATGELKYGQYDARIRFSVNEATDARWWTTGVPPHGKEYSFPRDGSLVLMRFSEGEMRHMAVHDNRILEKTEGFQRATRPIWAGGSAKGWKSDSGYHAFSLRWSATSLDFFIDGAHTLRIEQSAMYDPSWATNPYAGAGLLGAIMRFSLPVPKRVAIDELKIRWPLTMEVDYVRYFVPVESPPPPPARHVVPLRSPPPPSPPPAILSRRPVRTPPQKDKQKASPQPDVGGATGSSPLPVSILLLVLALFIGWLGFRIYRQLLRRKHAFSTLSQADM